MHVHVSLGISLPVGKMESTQMLLCCCAVDIVFHSTPPSPGGPSKLYCAVSRCALCLQGAGVLIQNFKVRDWKLSPSRCHLYGASGLVSLMGAILQTQVHKQPETHIGFCKLLFLVLIPCLCPSLWREWSCN